MKIRQALNDKKTGYTIGRIGFLVLAFLILSFAYELALFDLTGKDRTNPRLFDFAALLLCLYWVLVGRRNGWKITLNLPIIKPWFWLTISFTFATLLSFIFVPFNKYIYCVFYILKYYEILLVVLIFSAAPFDEKSKKKLIWVAALSSIWTSSYAFLQYFGYVSKERYLPNHELIPAMEGALNSTLGHNYFHLGMYSLLGGLIGFALLASSKSFMVRLFTLVIIAMNLAAATLSGSKAALLGIVLAVGLLTLIGKAKSKFGIIFVGVLALVLISYIYSGSLVKNRLEKGHGGTPVERLLHGPRTLVTAFETHGVKLLIAGGGFYIVPLRDGVDGANQLHYRIGYGNHNIYLFPLEQAGLLAFACAIWFWYSVYITLKARRKGKASKDIDFCFASSMFIYLIVMMITGVAGQVFFIGFNTEHFTVYVLLMFILAAHVTKDSENSKPVKQEPVVRISSKFR